MLSSPGETVNRLALKVSISRQFVRPSGTADQTKAAGDGVPGRRIAPFAKRSGSLFRFGSSAPTPAADVPLHPLQPLAQVGHPLLRPFGLDFGPPEFVQRPGQYGFTVGLARFFFLAPRPAARRRRAVRPPRRFGRPRRL